MKTNTDLDKQIMNVLHTAQGGLRSEQIRNRLGNPKPDTKRFNRSMKRLWKQCEISRIDKPNEWGRHRFYIPSSMFGHREETRLMDALFGAAMSYLEDLCQIMPFDQAWECFLGNVYNWFLSLQYPDVRKAYRDFFNPTPR